MFFVSPSSPSGTKLLPDPGRLRAHEYYLERIESILSDEIDFADHIHLNEKRMLWSHTKSHWGNWSTGHFWFPWTPDGEWGIAHDKIRDANWIMSMIDVSFSIGNTPETRVPYFHSQGEMAFLKIFSRIHDGFCRRVAQLKSEGLPNGNNRTTVLILDEVDLALHPEWQRRFTDELCRLLNSGLAGSRVQVVMTSHSPLLASDFPHIWCTRLHRNSQARLPYTTMGDASSKTFAGNLYDLLSDEFYLQGSVGTFASRAIRSEMASRRDGEPLRDASLLSLIRDPVIRHILENTGTAT